MARLLHDSIFDSGKIRPLTRINGFGIIAAREQIISIASPVESFVSFPFPFPFFPYLLTVSTLSLPFQPSHDLHRQKKLYGSPH